MTYERGGKQKECYAESDVERVGCVFCGSSTYKEIYKERGALGVVRCKSCGLVYVNPRLKAPEEVYWGDAEAYFKEARLIFEGKAAHHRDPNYLADLRLIRRYKPAGNFLDVGTNMGFFLRNAKRFSWDLFGVEPSPSLSEMARKYFGLNVKTAFLEDAGFRDDFFDVVSMTDVFEHIASPAPLLAETRRVLKPDGILFIKVPNGAYNLLKLRLARMAGKIKDYDLFDSYEHVVHYTHKTLSSMLEKHGFRVARVGIGKPIQLPCWHKLVGQYYQYPSPWILDWKKHSARSLFYLLSLLEFRLRLNRVGSLAPNIIAISKKAR